MNLGFFTKCYIVGLGCAFGIGPIFMLTFSRGLEFGFWYGFVTALGASVADGVLFALSLTGVLALLLQFKEVLIVIDLVGGLFMIYYGLKLLYKKVGAMRGGGEKHVEPIYLIPFKSFFINLFNPSVFFFFTWIVIQILPLAAHDVDLTNVLGGSLSLSAGTLTVLSLVSFTSRYVSKSFIGTKLLFLSRVNALLLIAVGSYFILHLGVDGLSLFDIFKP